MCNVSEKDGCWVKAEAVALTFVIRKADHRGR
jgi:hypothetical protein